MGLEQTICDYGLPLSHKFLQPYNPIILSSYWINIFHKLTPCHRLLGGGNNTFCLKQTGFADAGQFSGQVFLDFTVHMLLL